MKTLMDRCGGYRQQRLILIGMLSLVILMAVQDSSWGQSDYLDTDLEDLFDSPAGAENGEASSESENDGNGGNTGDESEVEDISSVEEEGTSLTDLVRGNKVSLGGNFLFSFGYSAGWVNVPWLTGTGGSGGGSTEGFRHGAVADTRSALSLDFRIAPSFRVFLTFRFDFPSFKSEVSEFFADYSVKDAVYFRAGRYVTTWGISRFHPHTNLTARLPDDFPVDNGDDYDDAINDADSYAIRMQVPIGAGGFNLLAFTRNGFMVDPLSPSVDEIGIGGTYNLAIPYLDFTLGSFYHAQLGLRSSAALATTLFGNVEFYAESLISTELDGAVPEWGVNAGFLLGFMEQRLQFSGEYYYTTETRDMAVKSMDYPLITGHNIASGLAWYIADRKIRIYGQLQYNVNENSGLFFPAITADILPFVTLTAGLPTVFGDPDGTYKVENPSENLDRDMSFLIAVLLRASF